MQQLPCFGSGSLGEMVVAYAYGMIKSPISGMTTEQWCEKYGIESAKP